MRLWRTLGFPRNLWLAVRWESSSGAQHQIIGSEPSGTLIIRLCLMLQGMLDRLIGDSNCHSMVDMTYSNHQSILAGRISHFFDLRGPSVTVDTACSSSLHALHLAVQSIRDGESEQAIVTACHLNLQPDDWVSMSLNHLFSDEGRTYSFDNRAKSGFARGEGAGCLILKPLEQAIRDNDSIRSVILNTGTNQDGRTVGELSI